MTDNKPEPDNRLDAAQTLRWLADMGADEAIGDIPVTRYVDPQSAPASASQASSPPAEPTQAAANERPSRPAVAAAPELLDACKNALELLNDGMTECEEMEHMIDAHEPDMCVICQLKNAINKATD